MLYKWRDEQREINDTLKKECCRAFENAVCDVLSKKIIQAACDYNVKNIIFGGGVSANSSIKNRIKADSEKLNIKTYFPEIKYTGDNAAMIAVAGYFNQPSLWLRLAGKKRAKKNNFKITADPNLSL